MTDAVFPFPNENYLLDYSAAAAAGIAPEALSLDEMIADSLSDLLQNPAARRWRRTTAEMSILTELPGEV